MSILTLSIDNAHHFCAKFLFKRLFVVILLYVSRYISGIWDCFNLYMCSLLLVYDDNTFSLISFF